MGVPRDSSRQQQPWTHGELGLIFEGLQEFLGRERQMREMDKIESSWGKQESSGKQSSTITEPLEPGESDTGPQGHMDLCETPCPLLDLHLSSGSKAQHKPSQQIVHQDS